MSIIRCFIFEISLIIFYTLYNYKKLFFFWEEYDSLIFNTHSYINAFDVIVYINYITITLVICIFQ